MSWDNELIAKLRGRTAVRVLTLPLITRLAQEIRPTASEPTVRAFIDSAARLGFIRKVTRGVYLNNLATPTPPLAEAATWIRRGAVVSMQSVLGEFGITNNPTDAVTCVVPFGERTGKPSVGLVHAAGGNFVFRALPERFFAPAAGSNQELLLPNNGDRYYQAFRPEKALLDWLYLATSPRSSVTEPAVDLDLEDLDHKVLRRLAKRLEMSQVLEDYLRKKTDLGDGEEGVAPDVPIADYPKLRRY